MAATDFDFFHGTWSVQNRRLDERGTGCTSWSSFEATCTVRPLVSGAGFVDEITFPSLGYSGTNIGLYEAEAGRWAHYWAGADGVLQPPIYGTVQRPGLLAFASTEDIDGAQVDVRALWTIESERLFHWEQAFRWPAQADWEVNWLMTFERQ